MDDFLKYLNELKFIIEFDGKFVKVASNGGFIFEIFPKEEGHNDPHFHVKTSQFSGTYSLIDFRRLSGNFPIHKEKNIIKWAQKYYPELKEKWNEYHKWNVA